MPKHSDAIRYGYWPHRRRSGEIPAPIRNLSEYQGSEVLNLACTQTGLPVGKQRKLVEQWIAELPSVPATTIVFSTRVSQGLFTAACRAPHLESLYLDWSGLKSLEAIGTAAGLKALYLGSAPSVADLRPLASLRKLQYLFLSSLKEPVDLGFLRELVGLREFGLSSARGRSMKVMSLEPLGSLASLEMLWLVGVKVLDGRFEPLHQLKRLRSLRSSLSKDSKTFADLRTALPLLEYFEPVG